jgi:hypothetical protein
MFQKKYVFSSRSIIPNLPQNVFRPEKLSQTAAAHPAAELRGMQGAAARLIEI